MLGLISIFQQTEFVFFFRNETPHSLPVQDSHVLLRTETDRQRERETSQQLTNLIRRTFQSVRRGLTQTSRLSLSTLHPESSPHASFPRILSLLLSHNKGSSHIVLFLLFIHLNFFLLFRVGHVQKKKLFLYYKRFQTIRFLTSTVCGQKEQIITVLQLFWSNPCKKRSTNRFLF